MSPGYMSGHEPESLSPYDQQVYHLEKQLDIECKVKQGADQVQTKHWYNCHSATILKPFVYMYLNYFGNILMGNFNTAEGPVRRILPYLLMYFRS